MHLLWQCPILLHILAIRVLLVFGDTPKGSLYVAIHFLIVLSLNLPIWSNMAFIVLFTANGEIHKIAIWSTGSTGACWQPNATDLEKWWEKETNLRQNRWVNVGLDVFVPVVLIWSYYFYNVAITTKRQVRTCSLLCFYVRLDHLHHSLFVTHTFTFVTHK